jgi:hypothetical protein
MVLACSSPPRQPRNADGRRGSLGTPPTCRLTSRARSFFHRFGSRVLGGSWRENLALVGNRLEVRSEEPRVLVASAPNGRDLATEEAFGLDQYGGQGISRG